MKLITVAKILLLGIGFWVLETNISLALVSHGITDLPYSIQTLREQLPNQPNFLVESTLTEGTRPGPDVWPQTGNPPQYALTPVSLQYTIRKNPGDGSTNVDQAIFQYVGNEKLYFAWGDDRSITTTSVNITFFTPTTLRISIEGHTNNTPQRSFNYPFDYTFDFDDGIGYCPPLSSTFSYVKCCNQEEEAGISCSPN